MGAAFVSLAAKHERFGSEGRGERGLPRKSDITVWAPSGCPVRGSPGALAWPSLCAYD